MRFKAFITMLLASLPFSVWAQSMLPEGSSAPSLLLVDDLLAASTSAHGKSASLPIWNTPDGRWLATVALSAPGQPALPSAPQIGSPVDWGVIDITDIVFSGALRLKLTDNWHLQASLNDAMQASSMNEGRGLTWCAPGNAIAALSTSPCWALNNEGTDLAHSRAGTLGAGWSSGNFSIDLNYSMEWLPNSLINPSLGLESGSIVNAEGTGSALPVLIIPSKTNTYSSLSSSLATHSHWQLDNIRALDLGASLSRIQLSPIVGTDINLNQAALRVGLSNGAFSGGLIGRIVIPGYSSANTNTHWSSIDLGISWHTPWQGNLSIGTQNLWSSGGLPNSIDSSVHDSEANPSRVPYVQYHQDL